VRFPLFPSWCLYSYLAFSVMCLSASGNDAIERPISSEFRPRLAVLTDIGGDPDDQQSLVRLMVYANAFEIEFLMATAAGTPGELKQPTVRPDLIREIVGAYGAVRTDLVNHSQEPGWPTAEALLKTVATGNPLRGRDAVGAGHETEGSRRLVELIDAGSATRPLHISLWGGQTDLAQALWEVKHRRPAAAWQEFLRKFWVYDVADQDSLAAWMRTEFVGMNYILSLSPAGHDRREAAFRGMYLTGDLELTSRAWIEQHVRPAAELGRLYPMETWTDPNPHGCLKEGDTPSWFFFLPQGGNTTANPALPGWGGQYRRAADGWWVDVEIDPATGIGPRETVSRWRPEFQADFARRLAWIRQAEVKL
jgi:hypothetical protein